MLAKYTNTDSNAVFAAYEAPEPNALKNANKSIVVTWPSPFKSPTIPVLPV